MPHHIHVTEIPIERRRHQLIAYMHTLRATLSEGLLSDRQQVRLRGRLDRIRNELKDRTR